MPDAKKLVAKILFRQNGKLLYLLKERKLSVLVHIQKQSYGIVMKFFLLSTTGEKPFVLGLENHFGFSQEVHQYIRTKLIVKTDKATHIPSIERLSLIAREVYAIVRQELLAK